MATCPECRTHYSDDVEACEIDGARLLPDEACESLDEDLAKGAVCGEYVIEKKIGEGTFGKVYRAEHPVIGKAAAVKVLNRQFSSDPSVVSRFVAEARSVNRIRHRNIIDIFSFGTLDSGLQYFVMELLDGQTLEAYCKQRGRLAPEEAIPILRDIGRALDAAHAAGVAHRDLKPENVFLCFDDEGACFPKLLDFGIAKLTGDVAVQHRTRTGVAMGTPLYMSPEQCRGEGVDHRTDIYAFGAMAHEMLTGRPPFDAPNAMDLLMQHVSAAPPPMSRTCGEVAEALDASVLRMLEKEPADRPQTLHEATAELTRAAQTAGHGLPAPSSREGALSGPLAVASTVPADSLPGQTSDSGVVSARAPGTERSGGAVVAGTDRAKPKMLLVVAAIVLTTGVVIALASWSTADHATAPGESTSPIGDTASVPPPTAEQRSAPSATATSSRAVAADVELTIDANVGGIDVALDGKPLGNSAQPLRLPRGSSLRTLTFSKRGYRPRTIAVTPNKDVSLTLQLEKIPTAPGPSTAPTGGDPNDIPTPTWGKP